MFIPLSKFKRSPIYKLFLTNRWVNCHVSFGSHKWERSKAFLKEPGTFHSVHLTPARLKTQFYRYYEGMNIPSMSLSFILKYTLMFE